MHQTPPRSSTFWPNPRSLTMRNSRDHGPGSPTSPAQRAKGSLQNEYPAALLTVRNSPFGRVSEMIELGCRQRQIAPSARAANHSSRPDTTEADPQALVLGEQLRYDTRRTSRSPC